MYQQEEPGIYVYFYRRVYRHDNDVFGRLEIVHDYYESWAGVFPWMYWREDQIREQIGYHVNDKICTAAVETFYRKGRYGHKYAYRTAVCGNINCKVHGEYNRAVAFYDHKGRLFTPDYIMGKFRLYGRTRKKQTYYYRYRRSNGRKKCAYGGYRAPKTFQERKWVHAWDDEEYAPRVRGKRKVRSLPSNWDDVPTHNDKCWKTQSKRKRQWKEK